MAPRMKRAVAKRSSRAAMFGERRTKARQEPTQGPPTVPTPSSAPPPPPPPSSPPNLGIYAKRPITTGRCLDLGFLVDEGFTFGRKIRALGWEYLCSLDLPTYPNLVREFYASMARGSGGFVGRVRGIEITLTEDLLGRLLRLPTEGQAPSIHEDRDAALRVILQRDDVDGVTTVVANQLSAEMRLLHNVITHIFFPKIGRFDLITERDLIMMHAIVDGYVLHLPRMMMTYIGETMTRTRASLPYGMVLTLVFREFRVPVTAGEAVIRLRHTDYYTERSLERMGCAKVDGVWIRTGREQRHATEDEPIDRDEAMPGSPSAPADPSSVPSPGPSAAPATPPAPAPASASVQPPTVRVDADQMGALADLITERIDARVRSEIETVRGELQRVAADLHSRMDLILSRLDERDGRPAAPDSSASSQPDPAPAPVPDPAPAPARSAERTVTLHLSTTLPPRPPRAVSVRSGPASRTRSRAQSRASRESPPSITQARSRRGYSRQRSSSPGPDPIDIPSDQDW